MLAGRAWRLLTRGTAGERWSRERGRDPLVGLRRYRLRGLLVRSAASSIGDGAEPTVTDMTIGEIAHMASRCIPFSVHPR